MNKRNFLKGGIATGIGAMATTMGTSQARYLEKPTPNTDGGFRLLHITDAHIRPEHEAPRRCKKILTKAINGAGKIDLVLNGGDVIFAADYNHITRERTLEQWDLYDKIIKEPLKDIEMLSALGNHDMWWVPGKDDPMYGKEYVLKRLGQKSRYMSIEKAGWVIITLDFNNRGYMDKEQLIWLHKEAKKHSDKPLLIMSHQPLLEAEKIFSKGVSARQMEIIKPFIDESLSARPVHFLSGHEHILDSLTFKNMNFHCNGALSGAWWEPHVEAKNCSIKGTPMGYAIIDIYPDGRFYNQYFDQTDCKDGKIIS